MDLRIRPDYFILQLFNLIVRNIDLEFMYSVMKVR